MMISLNLAGQNAKKITGIITDDKNIPVAGASIVVKGTPTGVVSN